jgi:DNA recombination protein RmuC
MSKVASEVGSLQKVLSNTKNRGIMGEIQLEMIIDDIIPPNLYDKNVATVPKSTERVEFALKLPGNEDGEIVYLPIDSKFPLEDYYRLSEAYDTGDTLAIDQSRKALFGEMKKFAADIRNKYISPPNTTTFGVMFLPTEGLYAEVARNPEFFDSLRRSYGIIVAGPTTLSALLNSLLVGFKTLAIQKGAAHIEKTLGAAKKEFENFGTVLIRARDRIRKVDEDLGDLIGTRTNKINSALKKVQLYEGEDAGLLLGLGEDDTLDE